MDYELSVEHVRKVMREDLNMRYLKIIRSAPHANSDKSLILRQQSALKLLKLMNTKSRLINIDESWLGESDFRRRKWQSKGLNNSLSIQMIRPRITLIAAVDKRKFLNINIYALTFLIIIIECVFKFSILIG